MKVRAVLKMLLAASLALGMQLAAHAHTGLKQSTPAADAVVSVAPAKIDLVFTEPVKLLKLQIMASDHEMPSSFKPNTDAQAAYSFETPGMHPGKFTVNWAIVGADGHAVNNSFSFTVDPNAQASAAN